MENASKALLIAGGILLALMTLSLIVYVSTSTTRMAEAQDAKKASEELSAFNASYEAYNKRLMYGTDVISVWNKANNYNEKDESSISIKIYDKNGDEISINYEKDFKNKIFECINSTYDSNTGRISQMEFKEKDLKVGN